jgi:hypothetical protein
MIIDDVPALLVDVIADCVVREAEDIFRHPFPPPVREAFCAHMEKRAEHVYARNQGWAKKIRGRGNRGRDTLYVFMRHWLAAEIRATYPGLADREPIKFRSFANGEIP